jgi:CRP-like cAMP-binding protein/CheY-like chemotaxis protein
MLQIGDILKKVPFFRTMPKDGIDFIIERLKFKQFESGQMLFKSGDPGDCMYILISGEVKVFISPSGEEEILAHLKSGDYFGEMALLTGDPRSASVQTTQSSETFVLYQKEFNEVLQKYPMISIEMGKIMSQRLRATIQQRQESDKKKTTAPQGVSGAIKDKSVADLLQFCDSNSLTGTLTLKSGNNTGVIEYEKGVPSKIAMGSLTDDQALDEMLTWEDGTFLVQPRAITLDTGTQKKEEKSEAKKALLIVNNSLAVRKLMEKAFSSLGYNVVTAENVANALEKMKQASPEVIISDVKLSDKTGIEFCTLAREDSKFASLPFIFLKDENVGSAFLTELSQIPNTQITKTLEVSELVKLVEGLIKK